ALYDSKLRSRELLPSPTSWRHFENSGKSLCGFFLCGEGLSKRPGIITMIMKTIPAGQFKTRCLAILDEVQARRQAVVITRRGQPVAMLVPVEKEKNDIFGFLKGKIRVIGDVVAPAFTPQEWGDLY